jgi:hypothetical protein
MLLLLFVCLFVEFKDDEWNTKTHQYDQTQKKNQYDQTHGWWSNTKKKLKIENETHQRWWWLNTSKTNTKKYDETHQLWWWLNTSKKKKTHQKKRRWMKKKWHIKKRTHQKKGEKWKMRHIGRQIHQHGWRDTSKKEEDKKDDTKKKSIWSDTWMMVKHKKKVNNWKWDTSSTLYTWKMKNWKVKKMTRHMDVMCIIIKKRWRKIDDETHQKKRRWKSDTSKKVTHQKRWQHIKKRWHIKHINTWMNTKKKLKNWWDTWIHGYKKKNMKMKHIKHIDDDGQTQWKKSEKDDETHGCWLVKNTSKKEDEKVTRQKKKMNEKWKMRHIGRQLHQHGWWSNTQKKRR